MQVALEMGYRMIDTSGDYGTQSGIGGALQRADIERWNLQLGAVPLPKANDLPHLAGNLQVFDSGWTAAPCAGCRTAASTTRRSARSSTPK